MSSRISIAASRAEESGVLLDPYDSPKDRYL